MKMNSPKKQAFIKAVSFFLATAVTFNVLSLTAISAASVSESDLTYVELDDTPDLYGELPDSSELERMYLEQLFYGNGISMYKDYGKTYLTGVPLEIYNFLRDKIERVASGELTETIFTCEFSDPYTDEDAFNRDYEEIHRHLLNDLPQSFYWFDKTAGVIRKMYTKNDKVDTYIVKCEFRFTVSENYAEENALYKVDPSKITSAQNAVKNAQNIANMYRYLSDYEKILAYKKEICDLTEYDHKAVSDIMDVPYGNPWQIVYVFDGDTDTNAVCEGYAKAFQYLCDLGGVECYTVTGEMRGGTGAGLHMWNIVVLNGMSYLVDITNCDDGTVGAPDLLLLKGADSSSAEGCTFVLSQNNTINYTYDDNSRIYPNDVLTVATRDYNTAVHSHRVCAEAEYCPSNIHANHMISSWAEWYDTSSLPSKAGYYYLSEDVTLSGTWTVKENIHLCLNGKTVYASDPDGEAVLIEASGVLDLCDCSKSGSISRNESARSSNGGGVVNKGIFNLYSGSISGHYAEYGGGVKNENEFNMYGGAIKGNSAVQGGGVYTAEHIFRMYGGTIGENTASSLAGGVYISKGETVLGGRAVIKGNLVDNNANNLYIPSGNTVKITEPLTTYADIGVTLQDIPAEGVHAIFTTPNNNDYQKLFKSDDSNYKTICTDEKAIGLSLAAIHEHKLCINTENCPDSAHIDHKGMITWTPWTETAALPTSAGNYYLTQDVVLTESQTINAITVSLCLNGHSVTVDKNVINEEKPLAKSLIVITGTKAVFNLCDCNSGGKIYGNYASVNGGCVSNAGTFNMYSGEISKNTSTKTGSSSGGGGIYNNGTFNMYGGKIGENNSSADGGGVYNYTGKAFNMYGGEIRNNLSPNNGGGIYNSGTLNISGGVISANNSDTNGGGIYNSSTLNISGGVISANNSANGDGGGIYNNSTLNIFDGVISTNSSTNGGGVYNNGSKFNMNGGEIRNNASSADGGGVYNNSSKYFYMYDGTISSNLAQNGGGAAGSGNTFIYGGKISGNTAYSNGGGVYVNTSANNVTVGGKAIIKDNKSGGKLNDLYLPSKRTVKFDSNNPLTGNAYIGVTTEDVPADNVYVNIAPSSSGVYSEFFYSNNTSCKIIVDNKTIKLAVAGNHDNSHLLCVNTATCPSNVHASHTKMTWEAIGSSLPTEPGNYYLTRDITLNYRWSPPKGETNICLNGYSIVTNSSLQGIIYIYPTNENVSDVILNICDCGSNGKINGNNRSSIVVYNRGTFNMFSGAISNSYGRGVSNGGIFNMYGGRISENTTYGVEMTGSSTFNMYNGIISGNSCGVYTTGTRATFNMQGGEISENNASYGAGVYLTGQGDTFEMSGGKIVGNTSVNYGGGVYSSDNGCTFKMTGGEITGNYANNLGGGVYICKSSKVILGKDAKISENTAANRADDLYLDTNVIIKVETAFTSKAKIGIRAKYATNKGESIQFTEASDRNYKTYFECNDPKCDIENRNNALYLMLSSAPHQEHKVCIFAENCTDSSHGPVEWTEWADPNSLPNEPGNYFINGDINITLSASWTPPDGETSICLNGCTIAPAPDASLTDGLININSDKKILNLCDCAGNGIISYNTTVPGITLYNEGTFNLYSGRLSGYCPGNKGCVNNNGTFNMCGGRINGTTNTRCVYNVGTFNMQGGTITGSTDLQDNGAGVLISGSDAEFNMLGGNITANSSRADGGGVYVESGTFNMRGGRVYGNTKGGGVYADGGVFNLYGGEIRRNTSQTNGSGVYIGKGTLNMQGGSITENYGVGVYIDDGTFDMHGGDISKSNSTGAYVGGGTFNLHGGTINGNTSQSDGGGVYVDSGKFNMLGGKIIGNTSNANGGGVYVDNGKFNMLGGEISGNTTANTDNGKGSGVYVNRSDTVSLSGKIVIKDNLRTGAQENLYIPEGVTVNTDPDSPLIIGSYIGVTTQQLPDYNAPVYVTDKNSRDYHSVFRSDKEYKVANSENNEIQLIIEKDCIHSLVCIKATEPTCLLPGNEEYYVCDECLRIFKDENAEIEIYDIPADIEALDHDYGEWEITIYSADVENFKGEAVQICRRDESHIRRVELIAFIKEIPATCAEEGQLIYQHQFGEVSIPLKKLSHDYEDAEWKHDDDKHWQECKNCGTANPYSENPHVWDEGKITVAPTTEHDGEKIFTCGICGHTRTETLPKLEIPVTPPSETEPPITPPSETNPPVTPPSETEPPVTPPGETEPPVTPPSETEPPVTPPSETEPPVTPPSETEPPVTPPSETEPPVTPPSETEPPVTPPSETDPPVTPPSETDPPVTPPSETDPPVTPPSETVVTTPVTGYRFVIPVTSETTAAESTVQTNPVNESIFSLEFITEDTTTQPETVMGSISKRVESSDYAAEISDSVQALANNVLEQQESALVSSGSIIEILLTIDKINTVPAIDGSAVVEKLNGYKMWQYLDINLYKIIDGTQYKLSSTNAPVTIKMAVPETLRAAGRRYAMIRIHDGAVDVLNDLDTNSNTITFATDRFSIYALIYKDKEISEDGPMNTGVDSYTAIFLAAGITALPVSMAFTFIGTGIMGMSEASKNRVYEKIIRWGKGGGKTRKAIALALIFLLLSYYYTVGNKAQVESQS